MKVHFLIKVFSLFLLVLLGCKSDRPNGVPDPKVMAKLIADVHIAEASLSIQSNSIDSEKHPGALKDVLVKYNLNKEMFDTAVAYYTSKPEVYQKIYEDVLVILTTKEMEAHALKDDTVKTKALKGENFKKIGSDQTINLWEGIGFRRIASADSTRLNQDFSFSVDSVKGGDLSLLAKYKFSKTTPGIRSYKMRLLVTYQDGSKDSTEGIVFANSPLYKEIACKLGLDNKYVKVVAGSFAQITQRQQTELDVLDIRLKWQPLNTTNSSKGIE